MTGVDRRPLQFWGEFNEWARYIRESFGRKPAVREIKEWYNLNAVAVWPDPETRPTLSDAKRHAKGIRAKGAIAEYFRQYRLRKARKKNRTTGTHRRKGKPRHKPANSDAEADALDDGAGGAPQASRPRRNRCKPSRYRSAGARAGSDTSDFGSDSDGADEDERDDEDDNDDDGDDDGDDVLHQDQRAAPEQPAYASEWPQHEEGRNEAEEAAVYAARLAAGIAMFDPIQQLRTRAPAPAARGARRGVPRWKQERDETADDDDGQEPERGFMAEPLGVEHEQVGGAPLPLWPPGSHWQDHEPQLAGPQRTDINDTRQHPLEPPLLLHAQYAQPAVLPAPARPQVPPTLPMAGAAEATRQGGTAAGAKAGSRSGPKDLMEELVMAAAEATRAGGGHLGAVGYADAWAAAEALFLSSALRALPPPKPQSKPQQPRPLRRRTPPSHIADDASGGNAPLLGCATMVPRAAPANTPLGDMAAAAIGPVDLRDEPYAHALLGLATGAPAGFGLHGFDPMAQLLGLCAGGAAGAGFAMPYGSGPVPSRGPAAGLGNNPSKAEPAEAGRAFGAPGPRRQRQASPAAVQQNAASSPLLPPAAAARSFDAPAPAATHSPSPKACGGAGVYGRHASAAALMRRQGEGRQEKDGDGGVWRSGAGGPSGLRIADAMAATAAAAAPELEPTTAGLAEVGARTDADVDAAAAGCAPAGRGIVVGPAPKPPRRPLAPIPGSGSPDKADGADGDLDGADDPPPGPAHASSAQPRPSTATTTAAAAATTANTAGNTAAATTTNTTVRGAELPAAAAAAAEAPDVKVDAPKAISRKRPAAALAADDAVGTQGLAGEAAAAGRGGSADVGDAVAAARDGLCMAAGHARTSAGGIGGQQNDSAAEYGQDAAVAATAATIAAAEPPRKAHRTAIPAAAARQPEAAAAAGNTTPTATVRRIPRPSPNGPTGPNPRPNSNSKPDLGPDGSDLREEDFPLTGLPSVFRLVSGSSLRSGGASLDRALGAATAAAAGGLRTKPTSLTFTRGRWRGRSRRSAAEWPEEVLDDPLDGALPLEEEREEAEDVDGGTAGGGGGEAGYEEQQEAPVVEGPSDGGGRRRGGGGRTNMEDGAYRGAAARPAGEAAVAGPRRGKNGQARWGGDTAAAWVPAPYPPIDHHGGGLRPYGLMPMLGLQPQELPRLPLALQQYGPPGAGPSLALAGAGAIGSNALTVAELAMLVDWHLAAQGNGLVLGEQPPPPALALDPYAAQGFPGVYPGYLNPVALDSAFPGLSAVGAFRVPNGAFGPHR